MASGTDGSTIQDFVHAGELRTYYEAEGAGEPLLLLHGGFTPVEIMAPLSGILAQAFRVYRPERRAHGRTPDLEGPITYDLMARDTIAFMEAVGLPSAHLVGWSDGAVIALLVALQRPDLVNKMVLIGQYANMDGAQPELLAMKELPTMPDMLPLAWKEMYSTLSPDGPEHWSVVVDKFWTLYRTEPTIALSALSNIMASTLIIVGDRDFVTVEHAEAMQKTIPDARLEVVPGADHGLPLEKPDVVGSLVRDFLMPAAAGS